MTNAEPTPSLLLAAHGTDSLGGARMTREIAVAIAAERPDLSVSLCYLDVLSPSLKEALDSIEGPVIVVPMLLATGYHIQTDIPAVVEGRSGVRVARQLGPDVALAEILASRLAEIRTPETASVALAAVASSRPEAQADIEWMTELLSARVDLSVALLSLFGDVRSKLEQLPGPVAVLPYLVAEGGFMTTLNLAADGVATVGRPIGADRALVPLVLARYAEAMAEDVR